MPEPIYEKCKEHVCIIMLLVNIVLPHVHVHVFIHMYYLSLRFTDERKVLIFVHVCFISATHSLQSAIEQLLS